MLKRNITTVLFDLSEVYLQGLLGVENRMVKILGMDKNKIYKQMHNQLLISLFKGQINEDQYLDNLIDINEWNIKKNELKKIIRKNFKEISGTRNIIKSLKKQNYKLGLISVHAKEWVEFCEKKFKYRNLFKVILYSFNIGLLKDDKISFQKVIKSLNSKPKETTFIDDSLDNIHTANKLGIIGIRFFTPKKLILDLEKLGIIIM